jgi:hypothetical protein
METFHTSSGERSVPRLFSSGCPEFAYISGLNAPEYYTYDLLIVNWVAVSTEFFFFISDRM